MNYFNTIKGVCLGAEYGSRIENGVEKLEEPIKEITQKLLQGLSTRKRNAEDIQPFFFDWIDTHRIKTVEEFFTGPVKEAVAYILGEEQTANFMMWVEMCTRIPYSIGYYRRSLRSTDVKLHFSRLIIRDLYQFFAIAATELSVKTILQGGVTEEQERLLSLTNPSIVLAVEIEKGNQKVIEAIKNILTRETTEDGKITHRLLTAIFISSNRELYELTGKLLLAARLQEGLRQSIVETMDNGRPEAFLYMFDILRKNDLQRFSSIKRAVGTWTGLFQGGNEDRVNQKVMDLIYLCLADKQYALNCLESKDTLEVYIALWSVGFYSIEKAETYIMQILEEGIKHKVQTVSYFLSNTLNSGLRNRLGQVMLAKYREEDSLMPGILDHLMNGLLLNGLIWGGQRIVYETTDFFPDEEKGREVYFQLKEVAERVKKKRYSLLTYSRGIL
ncbi:MAG: hypothetical protein LIP01_07020 [Tannerellaceae bacterium]|nr:hypothetical protein [Tannerellaceae bacterium]